jgi:alpha-mannosidase
MKRLIAVIVFGIAGIGSGAASSRTPDGGTFPDSMTITVQPFYKYRADGKPGREILIRFKGSPLRGEAGVAIAGETWVETTLIKAPGSGVDSATILLPPNAGVNDSSNVRLTLRQGKRSIEQTIHVPPMRHWTVYVYPHSHVDIGYSNTQANVEFIHKRNIDQGIKLAEATRSYPEGSRYLWNPEVMWPFERYYASASPEQRMRLVHAVQKGELCLDAAYVNELTGAMGDEEMIQSLRPGREAARLTGKPIDTYVQVDVPGMAWGMVEVMAHEGIRYVMMMPNGGRGNDAMVSKFRYKPFWWVGQDGTSKVLFLNAGTYGAGMEKGGKTGRPWFGQRDRSKIPEVIKTDNPRADFLDHHLFRELPRLEEGGYPYDIFVVTWAMWDNALLDADLPDAVRSWNNEYAYPHLVIASAHTIMQAFETKYGDRLPVVKGDFSDYWTDSFGTFARETRMYMNARERLVQAETLWPMLHPGEPGPRAEFDEAWRNVVMCTEHTFAAENPGEPFFQDAIWKAKQRYFQDAEYMSQALLDEALAPASDKSNGALGPPEGPSHGGVAVVNTNPWLQEGVVTLTAAESQQGDRVVDDLGNVTLSQRLSNGDLAFLSEVPAYVSRHYRVVQGTSPVRTECNFTDTLLSNDLVQVSLDRRSGNITRLAERVSGRTINCGLNAFWWLPARGAGDARPDTLVSIRLKESGPLLGEIEVVSRAPGCRLVTRSVRLVCGLRQVEITNVVDKLPLAAKDGVHFGFEFGIPNPTTRAEIPWGVIRLEADQWPAANRAWATAEHYVDIADDSVGVTLCPLDAPLVESGTMTANNTAGWDGKGDVWPERTPPSSTIYSWVMNNHWFTNTPLTQDGPVAFRYRILIHGRYDAGVSNRFAVEQFRPPVSLSTEKNPIGLPIINAVSNNVTTTFLKSTADGKGMIVRIRSLSERRETLSLAWPARTPRSVRVCEQGEEPGEKDALKYVTLPPMGFVTLRVDW